MVINPHLDKEKFLFIVETFTDYDGPVKIEKVKKRRSTSQNSYLHILITMFAIEVGNTLEEMRTDLKRDCEFMRYEKNDKFYLRRSSKLNSKEMTDWIDWIRNKAGMNGIYLPTPDDYKRNWTAIEMEIESHKHYL